MEPDVDDPGYVGEDEEEENLIHAAILAILDDDEDGEGAAMNQRVYVDIEGWRRLEGASFQKHFRMTRETFQELILVVGNHLRRTGRLRWVQTPLDLALLYTLWVLANPDTFRSTGTTFGQAPSTIFHHYSSLISVLRELSSEYIKWPSAAERQHIRFQFERRYGYPGVVGCIDGTFFVITAPLERKADHLTRHHNHAFIAQAVCDHNLLYRDVYVGEAGSVGDRRVFSNSPLSDVLLRRPDLIAEDEHLLGDGAYPLSKHLIIPYSRDGILCRRMKRHNYRLSRVRASVERSFALLFGQQSRSKHHRTYCWAITIDHAMAAFVVHNFRIIHEVLQDEDRFDDAAPLENLIEGPEEELMREASLLGALKREYIALMFLQEPDPQEEEEEEEENVDDPDA